MITQGAVWRRARAAANALVPWAGTIRGVSTEHPVVAFTFDDGPDPESTPRVLDVLAAHGVPATFFVLGQNAAAHPDLIAQITGAGHVVCPHGWNHQSLILDAPRGPVATVRWRRAQVQRATDAIGRHPPRLYRFPYGHQNLSARLAVTSTGHDVIGWTCSAGDWGDDPTEAITQRVLDRITPGAIVLWHDALADAADPAFLDRDRSIAALDQVLTATTPSFRLVTVPELLIHGAPQRAYRYPRPVPTP